MVKQLKLPRTTQRPRATSEITVEPFDRGGFFIGGIDGHHFFEKEEDAKMVADALQMLQAHKKIMRKAEALQNELREFTGVYE